MYADWGAYQVDWAVVQHGPAFGCGWSLKRIHRFYDREVIVETVAEYDYMSRTEVRRRARKEHGAKFYKK
jgi:hypothetical protein